MRTASLLVALLLLTGCATFWETVDWLAGEDEPEPRQGTVIMDDGTKYHVTEEIEND